MRMRMSFTMFAATLCLSACSMNGTHPQDPYETFNRKTYRFNQAFDATVLKPAAKVYQAILPAPVRAGINNVYDNINMIPTVANDLLQGEWIYAIKDTWRFIGNSTIGIGGIIDFADRRMNLPPHSSDLGITFAKWGDKQSPYIIIPFLGPSTIRDGMGLMFNYTFLTPYPYLNFTVNSSLVGLRYIDLRSQMLETDKLLNEGLDQYTFMRDAYLQHRQFLITGVESENTDTNDLYVDGDDTQGKGALLPEESENGTPSAFPITTAAQHVTHRTASA